MQSKPTGVDKLFTKGFVNDKGNNQVPDFFASDVWNIRIKNGGITPRLGQDTIYTAAGTAVQFMEFIKDEMIVGQNGAVYRVNISANPVTTTSIGSLGLTTKCNTLVYGKYLIILTGVGYPFVYDGSTLTQLIAVNMTVGTNPTFGSTFSGYTIINSALNPNSIRISRPILTDTQTYSYDWAGSGSASAPFNTQVQAIIGTLNNLWIFTKDKIEYIDKTTITNVGGISSIYSVPLGQGQEVINSNAVTAAGDIIFFMTKSKKIGTIKYKENITTPGIDVISDDPINSIDARMKDKNIDDCVASFDRKNNLVKFSIRTEDSLYNNIRLIYDINNETRLKDDNQPVGDVATSGDRLFISSPVSYTIKEEEIGADDDGIGINMYFESQNMTLGDPALVKQFRGMVLAGQMSSNSVINLKVLVDNTKIYEKNIYGYNYSSSLVLGIGGSEVGGSPVGGYIWTIKDLSDFESVISSLNIRQTGKKIKIILSANKAGQDMLIDSLSLFVKARKRYRIGDKI